jgi:hypothetical protein
MKTKISILFVVSFLLIGLNASGNNFRYSEKGIASEGKITFGAYSQINVTGTTKNQNGPNSTIDLRVTGTSSGPNNYIIYVEFNDGNNWKKVTYSSVIGQRGKYYVTLNSNTYYFDF